MKMEKLFKYVASETLNSMLTRLRSSLNRSHAAKSCALISAGMFLSKARLRTDLRNPREESTMPSTFRDDWLDFASEISRLIIFWLEKRLLNEEPIPESMVKLYAGKKKKFLPS